MAWTSNTSRPAESGVTTAALSVIKQQKARRMYIFSIRSLHHFCTKSNPKYKENGLKALELGAISPIVANIDGQDPEVDALGADVIMSAIMGIKDEDPTGIEPLLASNVSQAIIVLMKGDTLDMGLTCAHVLKSAGHDMMNEDMLKSMMDGLTAAKVKASTLEVVSTVLSDKIKDDEGVATLRKLGAVPRILTLVEQTTNLKNVKELAPHVANIFKATESFTDTTATVDNMQSVIRIIEHYNASRAVKDQGSKVLAAMIGKKRLEACLSTLQTGKEDSSELDDAYKLLSSLSYIGSYASEIADSGGIRDICGAIGSLVKSDRPAAKSGLVGACRMIESIGDLSRYTDQLLSNNALENLVGVIEKVKDDDAVVAAAVSSLRPIVASEKGFAAFDQMDGFSKIVNLLKHKSRAVVNGCVATLSDVVDDSLAKKLNGMGVMDMILNLSHTSSYNTMPEIAQVLKLLDRLCREIDTPDMLLSAPGFKIILEGLAKYYDPSTSETTEDIQMLGEAASSCLLTISKIPKAQQALAPLALSEYVLDIMITHEKQPAIHKDCIKALDGLVDEKEITKLISSMDQALSQAKSKPQSAFRILACINGIAHLPRLTALLSEHKCVSRILKSMHSWLGSPSFSAQYELINVACNCVIKQFQFLDGDLDDIFSKTMEMAMVPRLKSLVEKQASDNESNSLVHLLKQASAIAELKKFAEQSIPDHVKDTLKASKMYLEYREPQALLFGLMRLLVTIPSAIDTLVAEGGVQSIMSTLKRLVLYESVQTNGFKCLLYLLEQRPELAEAMRKAGGVDTCKHVLRTYGSGKQLSKTVIQVRNLLTPVGELESEISTNIKELKTGIAVNNKSACNVALSNLSYLTASAEGSKIGRINVIGQVLADAQKAYGSKGQLDVDLQQHLAAVYRNIAQCRIGVTHLMKYEGLDALADNLECLRKAPDSEGRADGLAACMNAIRCIMKHDKSAADICYKKGVFSSLIGVMGTGLPEEVMMEGARCMAGHKDTEAFQSADFDKFAQLTVDTIMNNPDKRICRTNCLVMGELVHNNPVAVKTFIKCKALNVLSSSLLDDDRLFSRSACEALNAISSMRNLRATLKGKENDLWQDLLSNLATTLKQKGLEVEDVVPMLRAANELTTKEDKDTLINLGFPDILQAVMEQFDDSGINAECSKLYAKLGLDDRIEQLIKEVMGMCDTPSAVKLNRQFGRKTQELSNMLAADIENPAKTLKNFPKMVDCFDKVAKEKDQPVPVLSSCLKVVKSAVANPRILDEPSMLPCLKKLKTTFLPEICNLLAGMANRTVPIQREVIVDAMNIMTMLRRNPGTKTEMAELAQLSGLIPTAKKLLKLNENDPEVSAAILDYLVAATDDPDMHKELSRNYGMKDMVADATMLLKRYYANPTLANSALELLCNIIDLEGKPPSNLNQSMLNDIIPNLDDPTALANCMKVSRRIADQMTEEDKIAALKKYNAQMNKLPIENMTEGEQVALADAFAELCSAMGAEAMIGAEVLDQLSDNINNAALAACVPSHVKALNIAIDHDAAIKAKLANQICKTLIETGLPDQGSSELGLGGISGLLKTACKGQGNANTIANIPGFKNYVDKLGLLSADLEHDEKEECQTNIQSILKFVDDDMPQELTLQKVNAKWTPLENHIVESQSLMMQHFDFQINYTEDYSSEKLSDPNKPLAVEFFYGCKNYELLFEHPENIPACIERESHVTLVNAIHKQRNEDVCQYAVKAVCAGAVHNIQDWANVPNADAIIATCCKRGRSMAEEDLVERAKLIELFAIDRLYFNDTEAMEALIGIWDDFDADKVGIDTIIQVFRSMRKIVNDHWLKTLLAKRSGKNVPERLVQFVAGYPKNPKCDIRAMPDVLFLLGSLAVIREVKDLSGEIGAIEECLDLIRRIDKESNRDAPTGGPHFATKKSPTITNACLALANITIGHGVNISRFVKAKGTELTVDTMNKAMTHTGPGKAKGGSRSLDYEVANGAAVLITNTCFKRDDMKELFGKKGAVESIMNVIIKYDGSEDARIFMALKSIFKAIANLGLFAPNLEVFVSKGIATVMKEFFGKTANTPDDVIAVSLRTVSNLCLENTEAGMSQFGILVAPILKNILEDGETTRCSPDMLGLCFEVLGFLSRMEKNAMDFLKLHGIETVLKIVRSVTDMHMFGHAVYVLGIQATVPSSLEVLVENGVLKFLTNLLEMIGESQELMEADICVSTLRCVRRCLKKPEYIQEFVDVGGLTTLVNILNRGDAVSMIHMDAHRVIICCLAMYEAKKADKTIKSSKTTKAPVAHTSTADDSGWDWDDIAEEGGASGHVDNKAASSKPSGPRAYQRLSLDEQKITTLLLSVCGSITKETVANTRLVRCALGLVAYFACERVATDTFYAGNITDILEMVLERHQNDPDILITACYVLNNVAYASEPETYQHFRKLKGVRKALQKGQAAIPRERESERAYVGLTSKLVEEKSLDPTRFAVNVSWDYPLSLTKWDLDKYPNGVQDLPHDMREEIREGDKCKVWLKEGKKEVFHWKSSLDMVMFTYRIHPKEGHHPHQVPISAIRMLSTNLEDSRAYKVGGEKKKTGYYLIIVGPPNEDEPEGINLTLIFPTKWQRDRLQTLLAEWREAAAFGF